MGPGMKPQNDSLNYSNTFFTDGKDFYHRCGRLRTRHLYGTLYSIKKGSIVCYYDDRCDFISPLSIIVPTYANKKAFFLTESGRSKVRDTIDLDIYRPLSI